VLAGAVTLDRAVRELIVGPTEAPLYVVGPGTTDVWPGALAVGGALATMIEAAEHGFDVVIIDSPPINVVADAAVLGTHAACVLVVVRAGVTTAPELEHAIAQLDRVRAHVLGVVLNGLDLQHDPTYDRSYRYLATAYKAKRTPAVAG
jgi:tyrosine-protein kinase Etk/Wzc